MLRLLAICCLLLVSTWGCSTDLHGLSHLSSASQREQRIVRPYPGRWKYHYGDSPRDAHGQFLFASHAATDTDWPTTKQPFVPPGRADADILWLRTTLQGPSLIDPALFLQSVNQSFQAFLDGQLIAEVGALQGQAARRFAGEPRTYLPLDPHYDGRVLALRIYSPHRYIGVFGEVLLGSRASIVAYQVQHGATAFVLGLLVIGIGLLTLLLFALRSSESVYLYYGVFTLSTGLHFLGRSSLHEIIHSNPSLWGVLVVLSLPLVSSSMCAYMWKTLGPGPRGLMPKLALLYFLYFVGAVLLTGSGVLNLWQVLYPLQLLMLIGISALMATLLQFAWQGDTVARILSLGFGLCASSAVFDILAAMGIIGGSHHIISHYGVAALVVALGVVLVRRFTLMAVMTDRATRLEQEAQLQAQRLAEQSNLLSAAAMMAKGDLISPISVPTGSELAPLALALDSMRKDLLHQVSELELRNLAVRQLNEELRRQIEQRSRRLMETVAQGLSPAAERPAQIAPGKRLGDHYLVLATIGSGAMGTVFEVERVTDRRRFAAKVLTEARKKTALLRFAREAQILCRLDHPNLISIVDIDVTKDGVVFLVMELVRGSVLKQFRDRFGQLPFALTVLRQMTAGLATIHRSGIVHRDLKPANVLLAESVDGVSVKLADFGISILSAELSSGRYGSGTESTSDSSTVAALAATALLESQSDYLQYQVSDEPSASDVLTRHAEEQEAQANLAASDEADGDSATQSVYAQSRDPKLRHSQRTDASSEANGDEADADSDAPSAKSPLTPDANLTATGVLVGTPMYMAPELAQGSKNARPSADMFALGVIAYELLTGEMPYRSPVVWARRPSDVQVAPPLVARKLSLPETLLALLDRCLHRDPLLRPSAEKLHAELAMISLP